MFGLELAEGLTAKVRRLCAGSAGGTPEDLPGLRRGEADLFQWLTPVTAALLRWWFMDDACQARAFNFHAGQRQAILNAIVAHEVLGSISLLDLYQQVCPGALLEGGLMAELAKAEHAYPKYGLRMAAGTGKTWVMQALLAWQVLNRDAAQEAGRDDPRFTRRFLLVASGSSGCDRLLDAFLGEKREGGGVRDFSRSELSRFGELFVPPAWREGMRQFVRSSTCATTGIGLKATGNGLIAIVDDRPLKEAGEDVEALGAEDACDGPAMAVEPHMAASRALLQTLACTAGGGPDRIDQPWARANLLTRLAELPDLLVFNAEADHVHEVGKGGDVAEVAWRKSLSRIAAGKGRRFVWVDFLAAPYTGADGGRGRNWRPRRRLVPHIAADFDLIAAMKAGLVKALVLDNRRELGASPLDVEAERDAHGNAALSDGQRRMLRAGLDRLRGLETDFARLDPRRHPKMLVICEDTGVLPRVARFLEQEGLVEDEVMAIGPGWKADPSDREWSLARERLLRVDRYATPRVIVGGPAPRERFDTGAICVIVLLRSSRAPIPLERTIGHGLRLMWRDREYAGVKRESWQRIARGAAPGSLIDVLCIVEHPAFRPFYDDLMREGLAGSMCEDGDALPAIGDLMATGLREDFERYDFAFPILLGGAEDVLAHVPIDIAALAPFTAMPRNRLAALVGNGGTPFDDVPGDAVMTVSGYNELLSRLTRRIDQALRCPLPKGKRIAEPGFSARPPIGTGRLAAALDAYIGERLFGADFEPFADEQWRLLLLSPVLDHIVRVFVLALAEGGGRQVHGETRVLHRRLSEVPTLIVRESGSLAVRKCIYARLPCSSHGAGLERAFIEWAEADAGIEAFCGISEHRHDFVRLRDVRDQGLAACCSPDFLVRTANAIYLVETKGQPQVTRPDVQRGLRAASAWCERVNALPPELRDRRDWRYVRVGETGFRERRARGAGLTWLLDFARVRPLPDGDARAGRPP